MLSYQIEIINAAERLLDDFSYGLALKRDVEEMRETKNNLKKISKSLNKIDLKKGKLEAEKRLKSRFSGAEALNMDYPDLQKSSFHKKFNKRVIWELY